MGAKGVKKLFLFVAIFALFTSGIAMTDSAFADKDDDKEDKKKDKKHKVLTGDGPPGDKLGKKGDGYIDNTSEDCDYYIKTEKNIWEPTQTICRDKLDPEDAQFFDVFFDIELYTVDSFFDIFTDLQNSAARADSFFDVFFDIELYTVDSFFDIFTELQTDVAELKGGTEDINIGIGELRADLDAHIAADNDLDPTNELQSLGGTSLSCENQIAIATVIPDFSVDLTCLTNFSISGVIRDSETNIPISLVSIEFGPLSGPPVTSTGGNDGSYSFANLTPDTYLLTFSKDGYQSTSHSISVTGHHTLDVNLVPIASIDFTGVYSISPTVSYQCALGQVDFAFSGINVVHDTNTDDITIGSLGGSAPALSGSAIDDSFSATGVVGGTCTETYQLTASSIDENNVNGALSVTFAGSCNVFGDQCFNQNFFFTGTK